LLKLAPGQSCLARDRTPQDIDASAQIADRHSSGKWMKMAVIESANRFVGQHGTKKTWMCVQTWGNLKISRLMHCVRAALQ